MILNALKTLKKFNFFSTMEPIVPMAVGED